MSTTLDFEQPLHDVQKSLEHYLRHCQETGQDTELAREMLQDKLPALRQKIFARLTPWDKVQLARHPQRPYPLDLANRIFSDFLELHGDRRYADDRAIVGGFAKLDGRPVMLIATRKGRNLKQNIEANFGSGNPEGYRKALRLMKLADKANCPIVCLVDTPGAYPGVGAEERHIGESIATCIRDSFGLGVPIVSVITGEGGSGGALALCTANRLLVLQYAYYSVITPEGCSAILWRSDSDSPKAAAALKLTSSDLLQLHVADGVVPEPPGGAHTDYATTAANLKKALLEQLHELEPLTRETLKADRYNRFRAIGASAVNDDEAKVHIRAAQATDIDAIEEFFRPFVAQKQILPRSKEDILLQLTNFRIAVSSEGKVVGVVSLRDFEDGLCEIRSLAVAHDYDGKGLGSRLIQAAVELAKSRQAKRVFTLTMRPRLFQRQAFTPVCIMRFPEKVQNDCLTCPKRANCDETCLLLEINQ